MTGPLTGIRVLDLSAMLSGPWAADILGDQGADVIKVEPPGGEHTRSIRRESQVMGGMFVNINRSKRSVTLDLKKPEGIAALRRLVETADVLLQNFRPGVVERLGIGYEDLRTVNPGLVYLSITGFGDTGPYAHRKVYDPVVQALSGLTTIQAGSDQERPRLIRTILPDKLTAVTASQAICAALVSRGRTGEGQHIRLSMLDAVLSFLWASDMNAYTFVDEEQVEPERAASFIDLIYDTADGYITVSTMQDREWQAFCTAAGRPDLLDDPRFNTVSRRDENVNERLALVQEVLLQRTSEEWLKLLAEAEVPCAPALRRVDLLDHPQVEAAGTIINTEHPVVGRLRQARPAARFSGTPVAPPRGAPGVGAHSREVFIEAGLSSEEFDQLVATGVVGEERQETSPAPAAEAVAVITRGA